MTAPDPAGRPDQAGQADQASRAEPSIVGRLERLTGTRVREARLLGAQHGSSHYRATLADGRVAFAKVSGDSLGGDGDGLGGDGLGGDGLAGVLEAEARGLRWLADANAVAVPEVLGADPGMLVQTWVAEQAPDQFAAEQFGRDLAALHAAGAERFGSPWKGFIASLPLGDGTGDMSGDVSGDAGPGGVSSAWPDWYASQRLLPYLRRGAGNGRLTPADTRLVESVIGRLAELAGPAEPPSRIHGDCWSGNVLWSAGRAWLVDPAAQGGHRETDLAMLALFGAPHLGRILASYQEVAPLADGWRARVPLHQLHPLLVHVCLFGASYRGSMLAAARAALSSQP
jgi:fructosamine-3-kinase